ncbi:hypothetical protein PG995_008869 [Apiospora arundinis]|uniref:Heterokaryon incompatibility domain-containing protein n=1 Tax=Apiospora arundinis TaxID=335852 RepID=A0ABR2JM47_9PEZI
MATIGKIQAALASMSNENTAALININLDFSVYRCNPSPEFLPIGPALTTQRREEAESGPIHKTVCTLGFLFRDILPDTKAVFKAYGRRASKIMTQADINPQGVASDGPFRSYIGADGTSIWAAATSSDASIAVHLLACVLARAFPAKDATSIWVELVNERKKQIDAVEDNKVFNPHTYVASKQAISRDEIATFDASARAWLRRADKATELQRHQFLLVSKNIKLPYSLGPTYTNVIGTWTQSLKMMNSLLTNHPQEAADRSVLLAISSWHMYPDLLVFQDKTRSIPFKDKLFPPSAILSLGLEYNSRSQHEPMRWSLALSHLRYYGTVRVESREDKPRMSIDQLWLVALGCLFDSWRVHGSQFFATIEWLKDLGDLLSSHPDGEVPEVNSIRSLCQAATHFMSLTKKDQDIGIYWVKFGRRRGRQFLGNNSTHPSPYFGLRDLRVLQALNEENDIDRGIAYLRSFISGLQIHGRQTIVSYTAQPGPEIKYLECATGGTSAHHRWICFFIPNSQWTKRKRDELEKRQQHIRQAGEQCHIVYDSKSMAQCDWSRLTWSNPPSAITQDENGVVTFSKIKMSDTSQSLDGFDIWIQDDDSEQIANLQVSPLECTEADMKILKNHKNVRRIIAFLRFLSSPDRSSLLVPPVYEQPSKRHKTEGKHSEDIVGFTSLTTRTDAAYIVMTWNRHLSLEWIQTILALDIATALYRGFPGASISPQVIEMELLKSNWIPDELLTADGQISPWKAAQIPANKWLREIGRTNVFGCIAMFETGRFNMEMEHLGEVVALCSEDSIFVAGILISDPTPGDSTTSSRPSVRHLVGSIGKAGLVLLVSPLEPRIRPRTDNPLLVEHKTYDGTRIDSFEGVSFHLSFTEWKAALDWENTGEIDQEIFLVESVLSIQQNGQWIADIDVLNLEKTPPAIFTTDCDGSCVDDLPPNPEEVVSLDCWEEVLDPPPTTGVFRAKKNWIARLAVTAILIQQNAHHALILVGGERLCWKCLVREYSEPEPHLPQFIID